MRIALISTPWAPVPPPLYGGIELVIDSLARGLTAEGPSVTLFTTGESTCPVERRWVLDKAEGDRIGFIVPELRHLLHAYHDLSEFDIVHDHTLIGPFLASGPGSSLLRKPAGSPALPPVVTTIHGPLDAELAEIYEPLSRAVHVVAISHSQARDAPQVNIAQVIHHGLDARDFPFGDGKGGYALFLGRMAPAKGADTAIAAAKKAGVPLLMAAKMREPWEHEYFREVLMPLLGNDAEYLGEVSHERKLELLASASALLFPIRWHEPFGMVMIEAMACGTPVLAFPAGSVPEIVEDAKTGFICADDVEMADALGRVQTLDRRRVRAAVEGRFSAKRMARDHLELFEDILARHGHVQE